MVAVRWLVVGLLFLGGAVPAAGQTATQAPPEQASEPEAPQQTGREPTLPEVLVRPEPEKEPAPGPTEAPTAPGPAPELAAPPAEPAPSPLDRPLSYPRLSEELISGGRPTVQSIFDIPEFATVRTRQRIEEIIPTTTPEALQEEVGVLIQRTNLGGGSPFIRGLTGNQVLILVDGIRLNNSAFRFGPNQYFNTIDPGLIERIEVIRGPQSVLYGSDAIGGVINIVTRSAEGIGLGNSFGGSFVQRFSSSDTGLYNRLNLQATVGQSGIFAGGSYLDLNDLDAGGPLGRQPFTGYEQSAADLKFDRLIDDTSMLTVGVQHLVQHDVPRTDKFINSNEFFIFDPQQRDLYYVRWQGIALGGPVDAYRVTASFGRQQEGSLRQRFTSTTRQRYFDDIQTTGIDLMLASDLGYLGRLTYGAEWYHDEIRSHRENIDMVSSTVTPGRSSFPDDASYERFGLYLQDEIPLTDRLKGVGGVRYSNVEAAATPLVGQTEIPTPIAPSFQDWTGSIGLVYELTPCLHLVSSVSEGFRAPGLDDLTALRATNQGIDVPSPDLKSETSWNYEVGLKADFNRFRGQVFGFWTDLENLIVRVPAGFDYDGQPAYFKQNVGNARLDGLELTGEYLLQDGWSLFGNYAYVHGWNLTNDEPVSRIPPAQGIVGLRWRDEARRNWFEIYEWLVARQARLSARDADDPRIPIDGTPGYHTLNLRGGTYVGHNGKVSLALENVLDRHYRVHGSGIDGPGITFRLGYELFY